MSGKINKSTQPIDRRSFDERMGDFFTHKCQHFAIGTRVTMNNRSGEVIENDGSGTLTIVWDDGSMSTVEPIALN